jgi:hypothetical protein
MDPATNLNIFVLVSEYRCREVLLLKSYPHFIVSFWLHICNSTKQVLVLAPYRTSIRTEIDVQL